MATDAQTLRLQQEVLNARERALQFATADTLAKLDEVYFTDLAKESPGKLVPVLVRRNHDDWFAGFFVQTIGTGGVRLLICEKTWRLTRVKQSAEIVRINPKHAQEHANLVKSQAGFRTGVHELLSRVKVCATKSKKGSNQVVKSKNRSDNGSSPGSS